MALAHHCGILLSPFAANGTATTKTPGTRSITKGIIPDSFRHHCVLRAFVVVVAVGLAAGRSSRCADRQLLEPIDEVVCQVNTEKIGRRQVEQAIPTPVFSRLETLKRSMIQGGRWNEEARKQYDSLLMLEFRKALREVVRERLMLQEAKENIRIDEKELQRQVDRHLHTLNIRPGWVKPDVQGIRAAVRERMLLQAFRSTLVTAFDLPNKPEVEKYYKEHQAEYMLPPMVKLRIIKINMVSEDAGKADMRRLSPDKVAEALREDVVDFGVNFADLATEKSEDNETRPRGGLIHGPDGSPYIDPRQNRILAPVVRKLKTGSIAERTSQIFRMDDSWAFVFLEERRPAGPRILDTDLYEEIQRTLVEQVIKRKQKEWFVKALKRSLVLDNSPTPKRIPLAFFFPNDPDFRKK